MHGIFHDRSFLTRSTYATLTAFLAWSVAAVVPSTARAAELPMGLATGSIEAHMAIDGKQWAPLPTSSNPVYAGTTFRTGKGTASVRLKDGTQLELRPRTVVELSGSRTAPTVKIAVGQVFFRVPVTSQTALLTSSVRYQTTASNRLEGTAPIKAAASTLSSTDLVGEIVVNPRGGSRLSLQQGEMLANSSSDPGRHIIKAGQSVYLPQVGPSDPSFGVLLAQFMPEELSGGTPAVTDDQVTIIGVPKAGGAATGIEAGTGAALLVGLSAIGLGVGLAVSNSGGNASPFSPATPSP